MRDRINMRTKLSPGLLILLRVTFLDTQRLFLSPLLYMTSHFHLRTPASPWSWSRLQASPIWYFDSHYEICGNIILDEGWKQRANEKVGFLVLCEAPFSNAVEEYDSMPKYIRTVQREDGFYSKTHKTEWDSGSECSLSLDEQEPELHERS